MIIEGILSIQAGDNPRIVEEKLKTFLDPSERAHFEGKAAARRGGRPRGAAGGVWPGSGRTSMRTSAGC